MQQTEQPFTFQMKQLTRLIPCYMLWQTAVQNQMGAYCHKNKHYLYS